MPRSAPAILRSSRAIAAAIFPIGRRATISLAARHGVSLAPYIHALFGLLRQKHGRSGADDSCSGGSLATMLVRVGVTLTLADLDPRSFEIVRRYFHMPSSVEYHIAKWGKVQSYPL